MKGETKIRKTTGKEPKTLKGKGYNGDPFFVKKAAESKKFLDKHGFPKELRG